MSWCHVSLFQFKLINLNQLKFSLLLIGLCFHIVSLFWCPGTSCGPGTREGLLPAGDPETGAAAEESTEAPDRL